jgi:acetyl-CoA C-acetyltransferase
MSVVGGLTFGGGPVGNYMSHAVATMTERLRREGEYGLLFGNGGFANTNHCIVLSRTPVDHGAPPFDVQAEADAQRGPAPELIADYAGPATIETYTVFYTRDGAPRDGVVVARAPDGARFLAHVAGDDTESITLLTSGEREPVGSYGTVVTSNDISTWRL